jgi:hypothetical protein
VSYNNNDGFIIYKPDGQMHVFRESSRGLFYLDTKEKGKVPDAVTMIMTVEGKKASYSARDYKRAKLA